MSKQPAKYIDEFFVRPRWRDRIEVYRMEGGAPGGREVFYCECQTNTAAVEIAKALNFYHAAEFEKKRK